MTFQQACEIVKTIEPSIRSNSDRFKTAVVVLLGSHNLTFDTKTLMKETGYPWAFIVNIVYNLAENNIWVNVRGYGKRVKTEVVSNFKEAIVQFWLMVLCAMGELEREKLY